MMAGSIKSVVFFVLLVVATTSLFAGASGVRFLSFDASLLLGSDAFALERVDNINYALALAALTDLAEHADAVCLQGYWLPYQVMKLQAILTPYLAHSYSATPAASLCSCNGTSGELTPLTTCLSNCASLAANQQLLCGFQCLQATQPGLSADCSSCITGGLNGLVTNTTDFATLLQTCVMNAYSKTNDSVCYPYGGYSGNVLFSRSPLKNATTRSLAIPNFFNSDAIFATSSFSGVGDVNLVCTQLQPAGSLPDAVVATYGTALNTQQTVELQGMIEDQVTATGVKQVVVMGNFKQSPSISVNGTVVVQPLNEAPYAMWTAYKDPIRDTSQCTYCPANPLISATYLNNTMSSHIFLRGFENNTNVLSVTSQVTLNTTTTILDLTSGSTPSAKTVPYSPNYGVQVDINTVPSSASTLDPSPAAAILRYVWSTLLMVKAR